MSIYVIILAFIGIVLSLVMIALIKNIEIQINEMHSNILLRLSNIYSSCYLLTIRKNSEEEKTIFFKGSIANYILLEKEMGNNIVILNTINILKDDYDKYFHYKKI